MSSRQEVGLILLDWFLVIATSIVALLVLNVNPDHHHFSVLDLSISYGHREQEKVSLTLFIFLAIVAPVLIITATSLNTINFFSHPSTHRLATLARLRSLNTSLLGLGVSFATASIILNIKNLAGVPRPDFLDRCRPDVDNIASYAVGGSYGRVVSERWVMVTGDICQASSKEVNEGFRSFPSGYALFAFAGLWYLTLYLIKILGVVAPRAPLKGGPSQRNDSARVDDLNSDEDDDSNELDAFLRNSETQGQTRLRSAPKNPPQTYLLILPFLSLGLAIFLAGTRYFDFRNHGFDVLAGSAVGTASASFAFRLYGGGIFVN